MLHVRQLRAVLAVAKGANTILNLLQYEKAFPRAKDKVFVWWLEWERGEEGWSFADSNVPGRSELDLLPANG